MMDEGDAANLSWHPLSAPVFYDHLVSSQKELGRNKDMRNVFLLVLSAIIGASASLLIENGLFVSPATTPEQKLEVQRPISQVSGSEQGKGQVVRGATDAQLEEFAELRFRVEALMLRVEALQGLQNRVAAAERIAARGSVEEVGTDRFEAKPPTAEEEEENWEEFRFAMREQVDASDPDPDWSRFASDEISQRLIGEGNDLLSLQEVRCGATACRIRIQVAEDPNGVPGIDPIMPDFLPWEAEAYMETDEHDPSQLIVHLAREGETLGARSDSRSPRG